MAFHAARARFAWITEVAETMDAAGVTGRARPAVAVVGAGRAGGALAAALHDKGYAVSAVCSRTPSAAELLARRVGAAVVPTALAAAHSADVALLTVPDGAIARIAAALGASGAALRGRVLVHCSAAHGREVLAAARQTGASVAALHPLMALTGAGGGVPAGTHVALDADPAAAGLLARMVRDIGGVPFTLPPDVDRALYHAAAVLAGNAPLALLARAARLLEEAGVPPETAEPALAALLEGAARNARRLGVREALTGPVVRSDLGTLAAHLRALRTRPALRRLYRDTSLELAAVAGGRDDVTALLDGDGEAVPA